GPGTHGSTFGGNPLVSAAALAVIEVIERDGLVARAAALGTRMLGGLRERLADHSGVREVRGHGLMLGIVLEEPCGDLVKEVLAAGLLINITADRVVRLLPPLILSDAQADDIVARVSDLVLGFLARAA
ncbi:MAG: aminotransferase class III-fold pyridoxal phosphate-dependent enzyme, partial [Gammaproteobacteria bacterium]